MRKAFTANVGLWLFVITLLAISPILVFATFTAQRSAKVESEAQVALVRQRTVGLADAVEELISSHKVLVQTLAQSQLVSPTERESFHALAMRVQAVTGLGSAIGLIRKDGEILVNSRFPPATTFPKTSFADAVVRAIDRRETVISDLTVGSFSGEARFAIIAPTPQIGLEDYALVVTISPKFVLIKLQADQLPEGWIATVIDSAGRIVARTRAHDERVGQSASESFLALRKAVPNGIERRNNLDGTTSIINYVTLPQIGWTIGVGVPADLFDEPLITSRWNLIKLGLATLMMALAVALFGGWYMERDVKRIVQAAEDFRDGSEPIAPLSHVRDFNRISRALDAVYAQFRQRERALKASESEFRSFFENVGVGAAKLDQHGAFIKVNDRLCQITGYNRDELLTQIRGRDLWHPEELEREVQRLDDYFADRDHPFIAEKRYRRKDGSYVWVRVTANLNVDPEHPESIFSIGVIEDITQRKEAEAHARFLLSEVNHRSKNLLTVVQSVARHTAQKADPGEFIDLFNKRLDGIAASHDLIVRSDWHGCDIGDLIRSQLGHFGGLIGNRIILQGPLIQIKPKAAQAIGLAINELATNAGKYGALSTEAGWIRVTWDRKVDGGEDIFVMAWSEHHGPKPRPPENRGFGYTVLVEMCVHSLEADVILDYPETGLVWELQAAIQNLT